MAKTITVVRRTKVNDYYLSEIAEEQKAAIVAKNPKAEKLFEKWVAPTPIVE